MNYKLIGQGKETVLFLHGWGANLNSFNFFCENLKYDYRILQLDFVGHGGSIPLTFNYTLFDYAVDVAKLLKSLDIKDLIIVGHSFGVRVAIILNTLFDFNIKSMIFISGAGIKPRFNIFTKICIYNYKFKKYLNNLNLTKFNLSKYGSTDYKNLTDIEKSVFVRVVNTDLTSYLKYINCPVLLVWGKDDKSTPLYMGKKFKRHIKNSILEVIDGDHFVVENNSNLVLSKILRFL